MYAQNIKKLRKELRLTAQALADNVGIALQTVQNYELGKREPSFAFMYYLLTVYNVNINWLMTGQGQMFNAAQNEPPEDIQKLVSDLIDAKLKARGLY